MASALLSLLFSAMFSISLFGESVTRPPAMPAADVAADTALDHILNRWEKKSGEIQTIRTEFRRVDQSKLLHKEDQFDGVYNAKSNDLASVNFKKDGQAQDDVRILCTSDLVYQFKETTRQVFVFPAIGRNGAKADAAADTRTFLDKLSQPFYAGIGDFVRPDGYCFSFKIRVEDLKAKNRIDLMPERQGRYHLRFYPKITSDQAEFSYRDVLLDKETLLPIAVKLWAPDGKSTKLFTFTKTTINADVPNETFKPFIPKGWAVMDLAAEKPKI